MREPCVTLKPLDRRFPELLTGRSGWLCRVIQPGVLRADARILRVGVGVPVTT
ncbi:MAG: MOSC domain-containing protein [Planctomycetes bacterium]|nr:MOSC domain-containing protein [Planctomycetota bacterium]